MTDRDAFLAARTVSRETLGRLDAFAGLLSKWNDAINLVAPSTLPILWTRHILDSAQVFDGSHKSTGTWADFGSGAGFPGLIVAILAADEAPDLRFHLVESDGRKAAFLAQAARLCQISPTIHAARAETLPPLSADVLSARALAPLSQLLPLCLRHMKPDGIGLFPKGTTVDLEISDALANWRFAYDKRPSKTDADSAILIVRDIQNA